MKTNNDFLAVDEGLSDVQIIQGEAEAKIKTNLTQADR